MNVLITIGVAVLTSGATSALVQHYYLRKQERWLLKKDACLDALNLAVTLMSNIEFKNSDDTVKHEEPDITYKVNQCINSLACTNKGNEVLCTFKKIVHDRPILADVIVDLRNAVRKELGYGGKQFDTDREKAFITKIWCDHYTIKQDLEPRQGGE